MRPLQAFCATFFGGLAIFAATTARAQSLEPPADVVRIYAQIGALEMGSHFRDRGEDSRACRAYRHLLFLEQIDPDSTAEGCAQTQRLISLACR
jgi:hypothetical protein